MNCRESAAGAGVGGVGAAKSEADLFSFLLVDAPARHFDSKSTVEQRILDLQEKKRRLADASVNSRSRCSFPPSNHLVSLQD